MFTLKTIEVWGSRAVLSVLVVIMAYMYYPHAGSYALRDWDESIYAQVAKQSADWFGFQWLGQGTASPQNFWLEKPPLVIWLVKASQAVFGVTEFAARFWTPLFGAGIMLLTYLFAFRLFRSRVSGLVAASSFFVCWHFLLSLGTLNYDIPVAFFILLALYGYAGSKERANSWYVFWLGVGLGVLTKSVIGLLPIGIVVLHSLATCDWKWLKTRTFWVGVVLSVAIVLPWHLVETFRFGIGFWRSYLFYHVLERFTEGIENNGEPMWYYFTIFRQQPYAVLAGLGLIFSLWASIKKQREFVLPLISFVFLFLVFSFSKTKGSGYIVVVYPFLALLIGGAFCALLAKVEAGYIRALATLCLATIFVVSGVNFNKYRLVRMQTPAFEDVKEIGTWLRTHDTSKNVSYVPLRTSVDLLDASPALVYYSGRVVHTENVLMPKVDIRKALLRTRTHQVYEVQGTLYVVAIRAIP